MEEVLFERKGMNGKSKRIFCISQIMEILLLLGVGVFAIVKSMTKYMSGLSVQSSKIVNGQRVTTVGKMVYLPDEVREKLVMLGVVCIMLAIIDIIFVLWMLKKNSHMYLKIYQSKIEGVTAGGNTRFNLTYAQISDCSINSRLGAKELRITSNGQKYRLLIPDAEDAYSLINQKIQEL